MASRLPLGLTLRDAASLLLEALEEGAGEYDPALLGDAAPLLDEVAEREAGARVADLPAEAQAAWARLLARAGVSPADPRGD